MFTFDPGGNDFSEEFEDDIHLSNIFMNEGGCVDTLLDLLSNATMELRSEICKIFVCSGTILDQNGGIITSVDTVLLDTGAQGSNFVSRKLINSCHNSITVRKLPANKLVKLGNKSVVKCTHEAIFILSVVDKAGKAHSYSIVCSILESLSFDVVIGLIDLLGKFYQLFASAVSFGRSRLAINSKLEGLVSAIAHMSPAQVNRGSPHSYESTPGIEHVQPDDVTNGEPLYTDEFGNDTYYPWTQPMDEIAPEELETPDCVSFNDDILMYLTVPHSEAVDKYMADIDSHVTDEFKNGCSKVNGMPRIISILKSEKYVHTVWVPAEWLGLKMEPVHLATKPGMPDSLKTKPRPIRPDLLHHTKIELDRMLTYFYDKSRSPVACPLVVAPKNTEPFIRLCGDYRPVNPHFEIPQEPIPNVQMSLIKVSQFKVFVDLDMTNSFHQIPLDESSSNLLSVATPWGLFRPKFLPEGVGPATGLLQSIVRDIFSDFESWTIVIFDNFLVCATDFEDACDKLEQILERCVERRLVLKMKKSWFGVNTVHFFGYEVTNGS
jgi:hypothetical protein